MRVSPLFVSFYTPAYIREASGLIDSLELHGLAHDVVAIESRGCWEGNCAYKPQFLLEQLQRHQRPIVWLDADARMVRPPTLLKQLDCDVAVHYRRGECLSGTLYFAPSPDAQDVLEDWAACCATDPVLWDQKHLGAVLSRAYADVFELPVEYCRIFDDCTVACDAPVIVHRQASRRLKGAVQ